VKCVAVIRVGNIHDGRQVTAYHEDRQSCKLWCCELLPLEITTQHNATNIIRLIILWIINKHSYYNYHIIYCHVYYSYISLH